MSKMTDSRFSSCRLVVCPVTALMMGWGTLWFLPSVETDCIRHRRKHFCAGRLLRPPELCGTSHISCDCPPLMHFAVLVKWLLFFSLMKKLETPSNEKFNSQVLGTAETGAQEKIQKGTKKTGNCDLLPSLRESAARRSTVTVTHIDHKYNLLKTLWRQWLLMEGTH